MAGKAKKIVNKGIQQAEYENLKKFLFSKSSEKAKDYLVFPLFQKMFGSKFKKESDAEGADIYIEGKLLVELKSEYNDFLQGFFQALHYAKLGLTYSTVCVLAEQFIGIWKINEIPDKAKQYSSEADALTPPSDIGTINASRTTRALANDILKSAVFKLVPADFEGFFTKDFDTSLYEFIQVLNNLDAERIQINTHNFIEHIKQLEKFFTDPLDAIHCFYAIVGYWDITSTVAETARGDSVQVIGHQGRRASEHIAIKPRLQEEFKKFVENRYIFTNEGSGLTVDYYFSRFDEVITRIKPEYAKQHGIFFTDNNLSKFALWFVHEFFENRLSDKYIVLDPAGGSGNLVTSWKGHLKHKIVSELQPDLLKTIERRMKLDPTQIDDGGFTIIPKTSKNEGLNFLDKTAEKYVSSLMTELSEKNFKFDKPIAFLLNPPYKNTDENEEVRDKVDASYRIDPSIVELTGNDAGKERYLAFLGQIINISKLQMGDLPGQATELFDTILSPPKLDTKKVETPLILIFTPTSWLIPRPTYVPFRKLFDKYFKYEKGFIVLGNEFFKIQGRFPIAFTIWSYRYNEKGNRNKILVKDLTHLTSKDLGINWNLEINFIKKKLNILLKSSKQINFSTQRLLMKGWVGQTMYDFKRDPTKEEIKSNKIYGGLPKQDDRRRNNKTYGTTNSKYIGFMDDNTPVRIKEDIYDRTSFNHERVWFRLDSDFKSVNKSRLLSGPSDNRSFCGFDLLSSQKVFCWFAITKALNGRYPIWANQFDIWAPNISMQKEKYFYSLCFAFGLAENRCVVTKFEKDNPVEGAPEIFVDNPLCSSNPESFWSTTLDKEIVSKPALAMELVSLIKQLYKLWNHKYCKGQNLYSVGLQDEAYFKYFDYKDFLTPYSGLIQIKKYAELNNKEDLVELFSQIGEKTKEVREEIYRLLVDEFKYFE